MNSQLVALAIAIAVPIFAFWSILVSQSRTFLVYPDNVRQFYPYYQKFAIAIHHGYLPLWDANVNSGNSFVGEIQPGLFYPVNLLFIALFGTRNGFPAQALDGLIAFHFVLASVGTYLFCRTLGIARVPAIFAGILFSYTGPHENRAMAQIPIFLTYSLLPFAPCFAMRYVITRRFVFAASAGAAIGVQMLAGHFAAPFLTLLICLAIIFAATSTLKLRGALVATAVLGASTLLIAGPQIFFGLQHFATSYRIVGTPEPMLATARIPLSAIDDLSLRPLGLLSFFDNKHYNGGMDGNGLWMGVVPIFILGTGLTNASVRAALRASVARLWLLYVVAGLSLVLAVGTVTPIGYIWYSLPVLSSVVRETGRYVLIFQFVVCVLLGLVLAALANDIRPRLVRNGTLGTYGIAIALGTALASYAAYLYVAIPELRWILVLTLAIVVLLIVMGPRIAAAAFVAAGLFECTSAFADLPQSVRGPTYAPFLYRQSPVFRIPEACFATCRVFVSDDADVPPNIGDVLPLQTVGGYTALIDRKYFDFTASEDGGPLFVYDLLNVRYVITSNPKLSIPLVASDPVRHLYLYERPTAFPRVFSFDAARKRDRTTNDVAFTILAYDDVHQRFSVRHKRAEIVVFSEQFYPGWQATLDGAPTTLFVAGIRLGPSLFRAIKVPAGTHTVEFRYLGL